MPFSIVFKRVQCDTDDGWFIIKPEELWFLQ